MSGFDAILRLAAISEFNTVIKKCNKVYKMKGVIINKLISFCRKIINFGIISLALIKFFYAREIQQLYCNIVCMFLWFSNNNTKIEVRLLN